MLFKYRTCKKKHGLLLSTNATHTPPPFLQYLHNSSWKRTQIAGQRRRGKCPITVSRRQHVQ
jgi:hypothetical protein